MHMVYMADKRGAVARLRVGAGAWVVVVRRGRARAGARAGRRITGAKTLVGAK
jgi:hypothetical protein